ncbi:peptidoglycan-binding domain-containing protein [Cellulomonas sp. URHB0016]
MSSESFDDARQVSVTAEQTTGTPLMLRDVGVVTRTSCSAGAQFVSGTSPVRVDDRPVLALATPEPLWRDLGPGVKGGDVAALQTELNRLGYPVNATGSYGSSTTSAVKDLQRRAGASAPTGALTLSSVLWLPAAQVTIDGCEVGVAQSVESGKFATTVGGVTALSVAEDVSGFVAGDRVMRSNGAQTAVGADGRITDATFLAAFTASAEWQFAQSKDSSDSGGAPVKLEYALATPIDAVVVPPAALYDLSGDRGCLAGQDGPVAVKVVTSALGKSLVVVDGRASSKVQIPPDDTTPCV